MEIIKKAQYLKQTRNADKIISPSQRLGLLSDRDGEAGCP